MIAVRWLAVWMMAFLLGATGLVATPLATQAQSGSPQAFLEAIYQPYLAKDFKGIDTSKAAVLRAHFAPALAAAIIKDQRAASRRNEVPLLNGDPFLDAQDWEIANLKIEVKAAGASKATGTVTFANAGQPKTVTLDLVKTGAGWRIAEIRAPSGSLKQLFKL